MPNLDLISCHYLISLGHIHPRHPSQLIMFKMQVQYWLDFRSKRILMSLNVKVISIPYSHPSYNFIHGPFHNVGSNECWSYSWFLKCFGVNHLHSSWLTYVYQPYFILLESFQRVCFYGVNLVIFQHKMWWGMLKLKWYFPIKIL
jgi:hypothetical protein